MLILKTFIRREHIMEKYSGPIVICANCAKRFKLNEWNTLNKHDAMDHGRQPYAVDINRAAKQNDTYRTAIGQGNTFRYL